MVGSSVLNALRLIERRMWSGANTWIHMRVQFRYTYTAMVGSFLVFGMNEALMKMCEG